MLQLALDEHLKSIEQRMEKKLTAVFVYGVVAGVIFSHTGLLGFTAGIGTGVFLKHQHHLFITGIVEAILAKVEDIITRPMKAG